MTETNASRCEYDSPLRNQIIGAKLAGLKISEVSNLFGIPWSSVKGICQRFDARGTTHDAPRTGRPSIVSPHLRRRIVRVVKNNRRVPFNELRKTMTPTISSHTFRRVLASEGIHRRKARRVPYLSRTNKKRRLEWARAKASWTVEEFKNIIFSDECYVHVGGSTGTIYVSRTPQEADLQECFMPHFDQSPVKVMVWACIMYDCKGPIVVLDYPGGRGGGMNSQRYQDQALTNGLLDFYTAKSIELGDVYFQQDNATCHTSKSTKKWLQEHGIKVFPHPAKSPDVNPIENDWWEMKEIIRVRSHTPTSVNELKQAVLEAWEALTINDINKYVGSMPQRVRAIIAAKGGYTHF